MPNNSQYVMCINNKPDPELTRWKVYRALESEPGEDGYIWVIDDRGDDGLFEPDVFVFVAFSEDVERYFPLPDGWDAGEYSNEHQVNELDMGTLGGQRKRVTHPFGDG